MTAEHPSSPAPAGEDGWHRPQYAPYPPSPQPPPSHAPNRVGLAELVAAAVTGCVVALLGLGLAVIWARTAPMLPVFVDESGHVLTGEDPEEFIAADGRYALIGVVAGLLVGVSAWLLRRWRGPVMLVALALGAVASSWIMWKLGESIGDDLLRDGLTAIGRGESGSVRVAQLRAHGLMYVQAIVATVTYVVCASWARHPELVPPPARRQRD